MSYFAGSYVKIDHAYWYAGGIVFSSAFNTCIYHPFRQFMFLTAGKIRVACSGLIYQKSLRISKCTMEEGQTGQIINILSTDLNKLDDGLSHLYEVWKGPIEAMAFFFVIYSEIGSAALIGFAFLFSFIPLKGKISNTCEEKIVR